MLLIAPFSFAEPIITIESTISGSQEQPKMLVIIPWQKPQDDAGISAANAGEDQDKHPFLQPIERQSFVQKNGWLTQLQQAEHVQLEP